MKTAGIIIGILSSLVIGFSAPRPEKLDAHWAVLPTHAQKNLPSLVTPGLIEIPLQLSSSGRSRGQSLQTIPFNEEQGIGKLNRQAVRQLLQRSLFGLPDKTASLYLINNSEKSGDGGAYYLQFVTDPVWDRIVYGQFGYWIKAYEGVMDISDIAVDLSERVFVSEKGKNRVLVLKLTGEIPKQDLREWFVISGFFNPTALALSDGGTPFHFSDDLLYVTDGEEGKLYQYSLLERGVKILTVKEGFLTPTSIAVGRSDGKNNSFIYVVDKLAGRIQLFQQTGGSWNLLRTVISGDKQYFSSIKTDHYGQVYVVDQVHNQIYKFTPLLDPLAIEGGPSIFSGLRSIDIPFIQFKDENGMQKYAGLDQLFTVERWSEQSGLQRLKFGMKLEDFQYQLSSDRSRLLTTFRMTDFGTLSVRLFDGRERLVSLLCDAWSSSGQKELSWGGRNLDGEQVAAGFYFIETKAISGYQTEATQTVAKFYLPMNYWEDGGSFNSKDNPHLIQGDRERWGDNPTQTVSSHSDQVLYKIRGFSPQSAYTLCAEYFAADGAEHLQALAVDGVRLHPSIMIKDQTVKTEEIPLPEKLYADGVIVISIDRLGTGKAVVSQLWVKETGAVFQPVFEPDDKLTPVHYQLIQNFPNPFNPLTTIQYAIPQLSQVKLNIYNLSGTLVTKLVDATQPAGYYSMIWNAVSFPSGVYIYRLETDPPSQNFVKFRKMILVK